MIPGIAREGKIEIIITCKKGKKGKKKGLPEI